MEEEKDNIMSRNSLFSCNELSFENGYVPCYLKYNSRFHCLDIGGTWPRGGDSPI